MGPSPAELCSGGRAHRQRVRDAGGYRVRRGTPRQRAGHGTTGGAGHPAGADGGTVPVPVRLRGRAEDTVMRADVATARAVAPLDRLAQLAVGVVRPGRMVLAIKGRTAADELKKARPVLRRVGS